MSETDTGEQPALPSRLMRAARSAYDSAHSAARLAYDSARSAARPAYDSARSIERLERDVAEERGRSETLRHTIAELRFQIETLEKTYSKQLADARGRSETAESELDKQRTRLAELERAYEDSARSSTEACRELERITADRRLLYEAIASSDSLEAKAIKQRYAEARYNAGLATIDELMDDSNWRREGQPAESARSEPGGDEDPPAEEMISPDLVLSSKRASASGS